MFPGQLWAMKMSSTFGERLFGGQQPTETGEFGDVLQNEDGQVFSPMAKGGRAELKRQLA